MTVVVARLAGGLLLLLVGAFPAQGQESGQQVSKPASASAETVDSLAQAVRLFQEGRIEPAIEMLEPLVEAGEAPVPAVAILGGLYFEVGLFEEALALLDPLVGQDDVEPAVLYNAGRAALALDRVEKGLDYLSRATRMEPSSPARRELGLLLGRLNRLDEAYSLLRPWALRHPDDVEARLAAAGVAVHLERVPEAEELLSDLPQEDPGVRLLWAQTLLLKADPWGALGHLNPLAQDPPPGLERDVRRSMAKAYLLVGEADQAVELLVSLADPDPGVAMQLSQAYYQSGRIDQAVEVLEPYAAPLVETAPPDEDAPRLAREMVLEYGRLLTTAGRHADAIPYLRLATELLPSEQQAWQALGQALAATGEREQAQQALSRFQELMQDNELDSVNQAERDLRDPTGRVLRQAMELLEAGSGEEALDRLRREATIAPQDVRVPLLASSVLLQLGRSEEALVAVEQVLSSSPEVADARYQRGVVLMALERLEEAESDLRRALELAPEHLPAMSDLAVLLMGSKRWPEARPLLERVLELRPRDELARRHLERVEREIGSE